jgi:hypothetical protein
LKVFVTAFEQTFIKIEMFCSNIHPVNMVPWFGVSDDKQRLNEVSVVQVSLSACSKPDTGECELIDAEM